MTRAETIEIKLIKPPSSMNSVLCVKCLENTIGLLR